MSTRAIAAIVTPTVPRLDQRPGPPHHRREMRRRAAIEPPTGHLKAEHRMDAIISKATTAIASRALGVVGAFIEAVTIVARKLRSSRPDGDDTRSY